MFNILSLLCLCVSLSNAIKCWSGSTFERAANYPPSIQDCTILGSTFDTCESVDGGLIGKSLSCASTQRCEQKKGSLNNVICCKTDLCNDPNGGGGGGTIQPPPPATQQTPQSQTGSSSSATSSPYKYTFATMIMTLFLFVQL